ncbi:hypothetical protein N0V90_009617 [Kalmusia sp. IMI 367209]|nr:hypothetical protein N0V90_009617 [Kalmusia sp. IMI 367209]
MATMMDHGYLTHFRKQPERYFEAPNDLLERIASNQWSSHKGGLGILCFLMLNPRAEYRLHASELAAALEPLSIHSCGNFDCRAPDESVIKRVNPIITLMKDVQRQGFNSWDQINDCISKTQRLHDFMHSQNTGRSSEITPSTSRPEMPSKETQFDIDEVSERTSSRRKTTKRTVNVASARPIAQTIEDNSPSVSSDTDEAFTKMTERSIDQTTSEIANPMVDMEDATVAQGHGKIHTRPNDAEPLFNERSWWSCRERMEWKTCSEEKTW